MLYENLSSLATNIRSETMWKVSVLLPRLWITLVIFDDQTPTFILNYPTDHLQPSYQLPTSLVVGSTLEFRMSMDMGSAAKNAHRCLSAYR